jgi:hypothetical protein
VYDTNTEALARKHAHDCPEAQITPPSTVQERDDQSLFRDPTMAPAVDFQSQDGFTQAAGKKGKKAAKAAAQAKWGDKEDEDGSKKDDGEGSNGGDKDGDSGAGAGGDGDGDRKDDASGNGDGETKPDDEWDSFVAPKSKKKGKKGKVEEAAPALPPVEKFDAFHEIKLDDTGPMLDLSFDTGPIGTKSSSNFGAWGSSWNTGTTRLVFPSQPLGSRSISMLPNISW